MGTLSNAVEIGLSPRTSAGVSAWADPSGIRGVIRHGLGRQAATILLGAALVGAASGVGDSRVFLLLAVAAGAQFIAPSAFRRLGQTLAPETDFRIAVAGWPIALLILSVTGWTTDRDLGEVVAVAGFVMAALVAMAESTTVAVIWSVIASIAVAIGAGMAGQFSVETLIAVGSIAGGIVTGVRIRTLIEGFLGARRRLMRDVSRLPQSEDPFVTAELLLRPLVRWTPLTSIAITWFRQDGRAVILGAAGGGLPAAIAAGRDLPEARGRELRAQAQQGPWISGWIVRSDDGGYSKDVAAAGIRAAAYVPMVFEGRVIGLVGAGLTDRADDRSAMAEYIPTLVQFADAAAIELGPALLKTEEDSIANQAIDEILEDRRFSPVFQAVRRLTDGRVVGFEALTRFDGPWTTDDVFGHARLAGRLRDLELATLKAAVSASSHLPADRWLSLNCSPGLLVEPDTLAGIIAPIRQNVVIELSEHDLITDYEPIAAAVARLGPRRRLAVDDAGAGFASLRHILEVRPQFVKLDIGLVRGVADDLTRTALVAGFVRFAADAGFELIAEGIETDPDRKALRRLGVRLGQGFLLGRPDAAPDVAAGLVATRRVRSGRDRAIRSRIKSPPAVAVGAAVPLR